MLICFVATNLVHLWASDLNTHVTGLCGPSWYSELVYTPLFICALSLDAIIMSILLTDCAVMHGGGYRPHILVCWHHHPHTRLLWRVVPIPCYDVSTCGSHVRSHHSSIIHLYGLVEISLSIAGVHVDGSSAKWGFSA